MNLVQISLEVPGAGERGEIHVAGLGFRNLNALAVGEGKCGSLVFSPDVCS